MVYNTHNSLYLDKEVPPVSFSIPKSLQRPRATQLRKTHTRDGYRPPEKKRLCYRVGAEPNAPSPGNRVLTSPRDSVPVGPQRNLLHCGTRVHTRRTWCARLGFRTGVWSTCFSLLHKQLPLLGRRGTSPFPECAEIRGKGSSSGATNHKGPHPGPEPCQRLLGLADDTISGPRARWLSVARYFTLRSSNIFISKCLYHRSTSPPALVPVPRRMHSPRLAPALIKSPRPHFHFFGEQRCAPSCLPLVGSGGQGLLFY
ncbi:uncharacterized protein LOC118499390 [Phyllostomus discolor]|uniref:Uncharacterized protein LOC118499390 n=1 Tax=Phyllostomus discolor TaxID=89673 RepID=A0A7E6D9P9_9CHIR|nr:uncharacterized protein LOC118499390 [Phyllostomus discolor]